MQTLLVVGGGLFGSMAARYARQRGIEALVFDPGHEGAASPAAGGLFKEAWTGHKLRDHFHFALPLLNQLFEIRSVALHHEDGRQESLLCVPPLAILELSPICQSVTKIGDGWLEAEGQRHEGWVYVAAGVWSKAFSPDLEVYAKTGASFNFAGEREGKIQVLGRGQQAVAFVRDQGMTFFSDGTAEREYTPDHDRQSLARATELGLSETPVQRFWGHRPYVPGGPVFRRLGERSWLATGGRKMGTILAASFARRLVEKELLS